jgi:predicted enzyme related to lactoylglutathione lyase
MENSIVWADVPATDLDRAMKFYGDSEGNRIGVHKSPQM